MSQHEASILLPTALSAAVSAGAEILRFYQEEIEVEAKSDDSPLTKADLAAHHCILEILGNGSDIPILSEESKEVPFSERSSWSTFWLVDPLDGTKEFINKNDEFTVNIALVSDGRPLAGVVYVPALQCLYFGIDGLGAYQLEIAPEEGPSLACRSLASISEVATEIDGTSKEERPYTVIGSRSHGSPEYEAFVSELAKEHPDLKTISAGSSLKLCRVAEGAADIYPRLGRTMEWDTAAGHGVVQAAGKSVFVFDSEEELRYNKEDLANPWFVVR